MDEPLPLPLGALALAMLDPARRRVVPVAKAVGRAGPAVTGATMIGVSGIVNAVFREVRTGPQARGWRRWSVL
ncbi:MAG: hypothetical protein ACRD0V_20965 [Acidimicrobiales bacterium]